MDFFVPFIGFSIKCLSNISHTIYFPGHNYITFRIIDKIVISLDTILYTYSKTEV